MIDKEKKRFHEMAERIRHDTSWKCKTMYHKGNGSWTRKEETNERSKCAETIICEICLLWFCNDERNKVKALNPEYGVGDIAKELGRNDGIQNKVGKAILSPCKHNNKRRKSCLTSSGCSTTGSQQAAQHHEDHDDDDGEGDEDENQ
ncbi:High mobility group protein DSP1 [Eumeta japonica]|uniref:High mobility group protein DSP1 n=1 Tax=Eumeta variegata TaxID=151549 RepID=A0A4C1T8L2_EUMVA|nr:High mobility group protein DSP1 [Eumeta japonica]